MTRPTLPPREVQLALCEAWVLIMRHAESLAETLKADFLTVRYDQGTAVTWDHGDLSLTHAGLTEAAGFQARLSIDQVEAAARDLGRSPEAAASAAVTDEDIHAWLSDCEWAPGFNIRPRGDTS